MSSIKDVAERAGVSYTTVSHVINGTRTVSPETTERVKSAIAEIGYVPSFTARSLRKGRTKTIGVIDAATLDLFFTEVMRTAQLILEESGYSLYFSFCDFPHEDCSAQQEWFAKKELEYLDQLIARDVDAIIINPINNDRVLEEYLSRVSIPVVLFQRKLQGQKNYPVLSDDYAGGYQAAKHLTGLGHRDIAVIYGYSYLSHAVTMRKKGFDEALREAGIALPESSWIDGRYDAETSYEKSRTLLTSSNPPTAIFYYSDTMAIAGLRAAADLGVRVPRDLSIVGYDDIQFSRFSVPRLTTVRQDSRVMGKFIGEKVMELIADNPDDPELKGPAWKEELLPVTLKVRESTAQRSSQG